MFFTISAVFNRYKFCIKQLHPRYRNITKLLQVAIQVYLKYVTKILNIFIKQNIREKKQQTTHKTNPPRGVDYE